MGIKTGMALGYQSMIMLDELSSMSIAKLFLFLEKKTSSRRIGVVLHKEMKRFKAWHPINI